MQVKKRFKRSYVHGDPTTVRRPIRTGMPVQPKGTCTRHLDRPTLIRFTLLISSRVHFVPPKEEPVSSISADNGTVCILAMTNDANEEKSIHPELDATEQMVRVAINGARAIFLLPLGLFRCRSRLDAADVLKPNFRRRTFIRIRIGFARIDGRVQPRAFLQHGLSQVVLPPDNAMVLCHESDQSMNVLCVIARAVSRVSFRSAQTVGVDDQIIIANSARGEDLSHFASLRSVRNGCVIAGTGVASGDFRVKVKDQGLAKLQQVRSIGTHIGGGRVKAGFGTLTVVSCDGVGNLIERENKKHRKVSVFGNEKMPRHVDSTALNEFIYVPKPKGPTCRQTLDRYKSHW